MRERRRDADRSPEERKIYSRRFDLHQYFSPASRNTKKFIYHDESRGISMIHDANNMTGDPNTLVVAVDGACPHNGSELATRSSFGIYFGEGSLFNMYDKVYTDRVAHGHTSNHAELMAVYKALHVIKNSPLLRDWRLMNRESLTAIIMTDSQYVYNCFTLWIFKWRKNGFINSKGDSVKHEKLIEMIDANIESLQNENIVIRFWCVPREDNKGADKLANLALQDGPVSVYSESISRPHLLSQLYTLQSIRTEGLDLCRFVLPRLECKHFAPLIDIIQPLVLSGRDTEENVHALLGPRPGGAAFYFARNFVRLALYLLLEIADGYTTPGSWQPMLTFPFTFGKFTTSPRDFSEESVAGLKRVKEEWLYLDEQTVNSLFDIMEGMKKVMHVKRLVPMAIGAIVPRMR